MRLILISLLAFGLGFLLGRLSSSPTAPRNSKIGDAPAQHSSVVEDKTKRFMPVADPQAEIRLHGRLLGPKGRLRAGMQFRAALISPKGRVGAFGQTDDFGHFIWSHQGAVPPGVTHFEIWPQRIPRAHLSIWPAPRERARFRLDAPLRQGDLSVGDLTLAPVAVLAAGVVSGADGEALAGAKVRAEGQLSPVGQQAYSLQPLTLDLGEIEKNPFVVEAETDAEGRFSLKHAAEFVSVTISVEAQGHRPLEPASYPIAEAGHLELVLRPTK